MSEVKWIKIVTDIFDDEKVLLIESLPDADAIIVIWFKLLCLAGKQNNKGVFLLNDRIAYTDEMFATIFRRNVSTIRLALNTFENFGMIEIVDGVITIPNWDKHQSLDALEKKREYQRDLMRKKRAEQKLICEANSDTNSKANSDTNSEANVSSLDKNKNKIRIDKDNNNISSAKLTDDFEKLWSLYPRKQGKKQAFEAYKRAIKDGDTNEQIEAGIKAYIEYINAEHIQNSYIKQGSTYFNGRCWNDSYDISGVNNNGRFNEYGGISNPNADYRHLDKNII